MIMKQDKDYYIGSEASRTTKEDCLIAFGLDKADKIYEDIMNEYYQSNGYNDETDVIGSNQFLSLFHYFAKCLVERGWNKRDLNKEINEILKVFKLERTEEETQ